MSLFDMLLVAKSIFLKSSFRTLGQVNFEKVWIDFPCVDCEFTHLAQSINIAWKKGYAHEEKFVESFKIVPMCNILLFSFSSIYTKPPAILRRRRWNRFKRKTCRNSQVYNSTNSIGQRITLCRQSLVYD